MFDYVRLFTIGIQKELLCLRLESSKYFSFNSSKDGLRCCHGHVILLVIDIALSNPNHAHFTFLNENSQVQRECSQTVAFRQYFFLRSSIATIRMGSDFINFHIIGCIADDLSVLRSYLSPRHDPSLTWLQCNQYRDFQQSRVAGNRIQGLNDVQLISFQYLHRDITKAISTSKLSRQDTIMMIPTTIIRYYSCIMVSPIGNLRKMHILHASL
jgi:hypothetical protein